MKKTFLTGLVILLPLAITVWFARYIVNFLTRPFVGIASSLLSDLFVPKQIIHFSSQVFILIALFLFIVLLGLFAQRFFVHYLLKTGDQILHKIPLVNKIYKLSKEMIHSLFSEDKKTFKNVVMLRFPYEGCYVLGLVARDCPASCCASTKEEMLTIYIPTTPNPSTGFLVMRPKGDLIYLKMSPEEAIKYIVSCAVILPEPAKENPAP